MGLKGEVGKFALASLDVFSLGEKCLACAEAVGSGVDVYSNGVEAVGEAVGKPSASGSKVQDRESFFKPDEVVEFFKGVRPLCPMSVEGGKKQ